MTFNDAARQQKWLGDADPRGVKLLGAGDDFHAALALETPPINPV